MSIFWGILPNSEILGSKLESTRCHFLQHQLLLIERGGILSPPNEGNSVSEHLQDFSFASRFSELRVYGSLWDIHSSLVFLEALCYFHLFFMLGESSQYYHFKCISLSRFCISLFNNRTFPALLMPLKLFSIKKEECICLSSLHSFELN